MYITICRCTLAGMKKHYYHLRIQAYMLSLAFICLAFFTTVSAQTYSPPLGSKTIYHPDSSNDKDAPQGYIPFFINHVSRHGARHLTNYKELSLLNKFLQNAADSGALSSDGERLERMIQLLLSIEKKYTPGSLTKIGEEEQYGIGKRMGENYPSAVRLPDDCINVTVTKELRTEQSADNFLNGLSYSTKKDTLVCLNRKGIDSIHLRFYSLAPTYLAFEKKGSWKKFIDQLESSDTIQTINHTIVERFFSPAFTIRLEQGQFKEIATASTFTSLLYAAASITAGLKSEIKMSGLKPDDVNIFLLLKPDEVKCLALVDGAEDFLVKGPAIDPEGIQVRDAVPLLIDFIQTSDKHLAENKKGADLRFAHGETIAPIAALMELEGADVPATNIFRYEDVWKIERIMCYSGNIQWVFYKKQNGKKEKDTSTYLVKILFNESPVHIPVPTTQFPYYRWEDVRRFYMDKLQRLGVNQEEDMYQYLMQLK